MRGALLALVVEADFDAFWVAQARPRGNSKHSRADTLEVFPNPQTHGRGLGVFLVACGLATV